jgi:hypothetical protein
VASRAPRVVARALSGGRAEKAGPVRERATGGVLVLSAGVLDSLVWLFSQPVFALLFGIACGVGLLFASRASFRRMTPEDPGGGLLIVAVSLFGRLLIVTLTLWAYKHLFPAAFKPFALSLAGSFLVLYTVEVVRYSGLLKKSRPAGAGH